MALIERAMKDKQAASDKVAQYHKDNAEKHREYNREWARKNYQRKKECDKTLKPKGRNKMEELIKKLEYAKNATQSCLKSANCNVDMHDLSYWANEVERLRKEIMEKL